MQLDLFLDNERTIRLNLAHDALLSLRLEEALKEYRLILENSPGDEEIRSEKEKVEAWKKRVENYRTSPLGVGNVYQLYSELKNDMPPALHTGLLTLFVQELRKKTAPELIFRLPRFHIGRLLMELKEYSEAEKWFAKALEKGIEQRGRFLAWRGNALFRIGDPEGARECCLAAFLEDPGGVDLDSLSDRELIDLIDDLEMEGHEREEILSALPVWGWLRGLFTLLRYGTGDDPAVTLARMEDDPETGPIQLWYEYLRYAEYLRTRHRDDREMIRVRRKMKELAPELFGEYLQKLGMAALPFNHPG